MKIGTWFAIYFIIWWTLLFVSLPFGVRRDAGPAEDVPGADPGAPVRPAFARILIINTVLSTVVLAVFAWLIENYWV
ncbi:MAG: DUF1467 family protein [Proteobacteria bacterium]|nr:DUF1467 family protein [Pseudomonadota bacterium]